MKTSRVRTAGIALIAGAVLFAAGCGGGGSKSPAWQGDGGQGATPSSDAGATPGSTSSAPRLSTVAVVEPAAGAKGVECVVAVKYTSEDPENTTVKVTDPDGNEVEGTVDKDAKSWTPSSSLKWDTTYKVAVTGTASGDKDGATSSTFTTMAKPSKVIGVSSYLGDGQTVGVGMPLILKFSKSVPESYRDDVERHLAVTSTPAQTGTWHWTSATEVHYRPQEFWKAGTKIFYKASLSGLKLGDGYYGKNNLSVDLKIGRSLVMTVSNDTKMMTVKKDGKVIKTVPVSLGKPSTPSSSGTMVVMEKLRHTVFDTTDTDPVNGYKTPIDYAQRITYSGQFIHAASWSEGKQGHVNVSHGCVNVSEAMGAWLFSQTMVGDPITVTGTGDKLKRGNGFTDWSQSWDEYKKGSYL